MTRSNHYRTAAGLALAGVALLVWLSLGVGIIGADGDPWNSMYFGVIGVGALGAALARLRPDGMSNALFAMALAQALVLLVALVAGLGRPWSPPMELVALNVFFMGLFIASGLLFKAAGRSNSGAGAVTSR